MEIKEILEKLYETVESMIGDGLVVGKTNEGLEILTFHNENKERTFRVFNGTIANENDRVIASLIIEGVKYNFKHTEWHGEKYIIVKGLNIIYHHNVNEIGGFTDKNSNKYRLEQISYLTEIIKILSHHSLDKEKEKLTKEFVGAYRLSLLFKK
jgi:hypothetical protein